MVRAWQDSWAGGHVVDAMHAAGYNMRLMRSAFTWWAGVDSVPQWSGRSHDAAPWRVVQRTALDALRRQKDDDHG
jgi:hypothetical protein